MRHGVPLQLRLQLKQCLFKENKKPKKTNEIPNKKQTNKQQQKN